MCASSTCLPTPKEARELIRKGFAGRLSTYLFGEKQVKVIGPSPKGYEGSRSLPNTIIGGCSFFSDGLCQLHALGLKPLEGRLANHSRDFVPVRVEVLSHWRGKQYESVLKSLDAKTWQAESAVAAFNPVGV